MKEIHVITGVTASIRGKHNYDAGACGHIGKIREDQVFLHLKMDKKAATTATVFIIDGKRDIHEIASQDGEYSRLVTLMKKQQGGHNYFPFTDSRENYLMLANFDPKGFVTVNVIALIAQGGEFFLIRQQTHQVQAFRKGGLVVCPELDRKFAGWSQLADIAAKRYEHNNSLPSIEKFVPMRWDTASLKDNEVIVTVWSARRQSGGGVNNKNEGVAIYWEDIDPPEEIAPKFVSIGEVVKWRKIEKPLRKTEFVWEARGITRTGEIADKVADTTDVYADPSKAQRQEPVSA